MERGRTSFVDGETVRVERDEKIANGPVLDVCDSQRVNISVVGRRGRGSAPSSRMTLSPKTVISNLPVARSRERMLRMGRERALRSMAATPTTESSRDQPGGVVGRLCCTGSQHLAWFKEGRGERTEAHELLCGNARFDVGSGGHDVGSVERARVLGEEDAGES